ncbi:LOW QUALITY PROTEIN: hypothetical protein ACHAXS_001497, partial [Conticribra weissflogii]
MHVINGTWAFACKQFPNGTLKSLNPAFALMEKTGLTYAPVVQRTTICLMLILENMLPLKSKQADVIAAFLHATLVEDEKVYVEMPLGFKQHGSNGKFKVLCLKKTLYYLFHAGGVDLEEEDDAAAKFLGVHNKCNPNFGFMNMMQKGTIKQVLETLGLNIGNANGNFTPAKRKPLAKHMHGEPVSGDFNYSSLIEMHLYLAGHTYPDITYA